MIDSVIEHFENYTIRWFGEYESVASFEVFNRLARDEEIYASKGSVSPWDNPTSDLAKAERCVAGSIKWDGCANLEFEPDSETMVHICGYTDAQVFGRLLPYLWERAATLMDRKLEDMR